MPDPTSGTSAYAWKPKLLGKIPVSEGKIDCQKCDDVEECRDMVREDLPVKCELPDEYDLWKMVQNLVRGGAMKDLVYWQRERGHYHRPGKSDDGRIPMMTKCGIMYMTRDFGSTLRDDLESGTLFNAIQKELKPCSKCFPFAPAIKRELIREVR